MEQGTYEEGPSFDPDEKIDTKTFASVEEYNTFIKQYQGNGNYYYGARGANVMWAETMAVDEDFAMEGPVAVPMPAPAEAGGSSQSKLDYSETNVQVQGVDEADILKSDGNYIYTVTENVLYIVRAYPGEEAEVVATIDFEDNWPTSLFINGDSMAVFGNYYDDTLFEKIDFRPAQGMTFFNIYDISDRSNPVLAKEYKFEGNYTNARMVNEWVYFVVGNWPVFRADYPTPVIFEGSEIRAMPVTDIFYFDIPYRSPHLVTVHAINMVSPSEAVESKSVAVEGGQNLYMSQNNIFITYTEYINEDEFRNEILRDILNPKLTAADKELIEKIKATDDDVLSQYEKENKIMQVYWSYLDYIPYDEQELIWDQVDEQLQQKLKEFEYFEFTIINRIRVSGSDINVQANGKVPGHIINQFSLDEDVQNGVLRIATTVSSRWSRFGERNWESINNVYTLDANLNVIGELEGLAETEQIYSTRFMGDKLYMVTFRQVDPFFVIDLSDPTNIRELGELKIPGFSRYLHPYDENTIIGIGQDATETGRTTGLKISLFDVSDFTNPKEIAKYVSDDRYTDSSAMYEHKAFLFSKEKELMVIPIYSYGWEDERGRSRDDYNGALVFKITKDEIELRDLINHAEGWLGGKGYGPQVERSLYIEDLLYTKSPYLLKINELDDLSLVKDVELWVD